MIHRNLFILLLPLWFTGCLFTKQMDEKDVEGSWTLYDVTAADPQHMDFNTEARLKAGLQTGSVLSFFGDSSFTKAEGNGDFTLGSWRLLRDKNLMVLTTRRGGKQEIPVRAEAPSAEHSSFALVIPRGEFLYKYIKTAAPLADCRQDPFYKTNNWWRLTPKQEEDSAQVRERLANYFKHIALLLRATKERKETVVSFVFSQGPVKIYNGGIGIVPYDKIKRMWKNGFYNDDEAKYAYLLYRNYLSEDHYAAAGTGDWVDDDYRILMSMYPAFHAGLKELTL